MNEITNSTIAAIEQLHRWGDCDKHDTPNQFDKHCHCSIEARALTSEQFLTCGHCGHTFDGRKQWTLVSRRRGGRFYRPVANVPALTWKQAQQLAQLIETTDEVWYVTTQAVQASSALVNSGLAADQDNILQADGRRLPIRWDAEPQLTAPDYPTFDEPNTPTCPDCGAYPGTVVQESGRVACIGCGRTLVKPATTAKANTINPGDKVRLNRTWCTVAERRVEGFRVIWQLEGFDGWTQRSFDETVTVIRAL